MNKLPEVPLEHLPACYKKEGTNKEHECLAKCDNFNCGFKRNHFIITSQ